MLVFVVVFLNLVLLWLWLASLVKGCINVTAIATKLISATIAVIHQRRSWLNIISFNSSLLWLRLLGFVLLVILWLKNITSIIIIILKWKNKNFYQPKALKWCNRLLICRTRSITVWADHFYLKLDIFNLLYFKVQNLKD